ncbi:MAG: beta-lactamase family protein [Proteobacteria bacterium]|nr:beta-lactamase family protein [Pseudomonadota bacterium]
MTTCDQLRTLLLDGIDQHLYSCAQLVVSDARESLISLAIGTTRLNNLSGDRAIKGQEINTHTLFDVASLTKPLSTAALMMKACEERIYSPEQKLISLNGIRFPSWLLSNTIADLLSHHTQLPAWHDFHGDCPRPEDHDQAKEFFLNEICSLDPRTDNQTWCYSDLGYLLLGFMLENAYHCSLARLFEQKIAKPLGLSSEMMFQPLHTMNCDRIPATCAYKNSYIQGHPDDANARVLTHVAGHAGLFASAEAIASYVRALLSGAFPCKPEIVRQFISYRHPETHYALGWDRPTSADSLSARLPGDPVIGHLGFTGCSVWIDLDTTRIITLLTNRTHVNSNPKSLAPLRREVYRLCWEL